MSRCDLHVATKVTRQVALIGKTHLSCDRAWGQARPEQRHGPLDAQTDLIGVWWQAHPGCEAAEQVKAAQTAYMTQIVQCDGLVEPMLKVLPGARYRVVRGVGAFGPPIHGLQQMLQACGEA
jgi:hypothetical protein